MNDQELQAQNAAHLRALELSQKENQELKTKVASLQGQMQQLLKLIQGFKSERFVTQTSNHAQLELFAPVEAPTELPQQEEISYTRNKKKHPGRHALPENIPVREAIIEPEQDTSGMDKIGEEVTETLEYTPASLVKRRVIRPKYKKKETSQIIIGELPERPLDKCIAEASLLAYIIMRKYVEHMPFYRQIQGFTRDFGWNPAASTLSDWMRECAILLEPLYNVLKQKILESGYIQVDESPMKVLDKDKKASAHQGYQWVYHDPVHKLVLFNYNKGRGQNGPKQLLSDYQGILQCDGYSVYDNIGAQPGIVLAGCLVHARRKFFDAKDSDPIRAEQALKWFKEIYTIERDIKENTQDFDLRKQQRNQRIKPILQRIRNWIEENSLEVLPKSAIGKAMTYFIRQYPKLENALIDGRIELDNNKIENSIRPMALSRKNFLFCGSHRAAQHAAIFLSFFGSCKLHGVNPRVWLEETLSNIKDYKINDLEELLPGYQNES